MKLAGWPGESRYYGTRKKASTLYRFMDDGKCPVGVATAVEAGQWVAQR